MLGRLLCEKEFVTQSGQTAGKEGLCEPPFHMFGPEILASIVSSALWLLPMSCVKHGCVNVFPCAMYHWFCS